MGVPAQNVVPGDVVILRPGMVCMYVCMYMYVGPFRYLSMYDVCVWMDGWMYVGDSRGHPSLFFHLFGM